MECITKCQHFQDRRGARVHRNLQLFADDALQEALKVCLEGKYLSSREVYATVPDFFKIIFMSTC